MPRFFCPAFFRKVIYVPAQGKIIYRPKCNRCFGENIKLLTAHIPDKHKPFDSAVLGTAAPSTGLRRNIYRERSRTEAPPFDTVYPQVS
jgi:hypothetical protein